MSEAYRIRYLHLKNRLEELLAKHGPPEEWVDQGADVDPSWGPVGGLSQGHQAASASAHAQTAVSPQPPQNRVLGAAEAMRRLDEYGESPLFGCPGCGADSAKASTALDYWRCVACGTWGKASRLGSPDVLPTTRTQRV